jgi:hypothetical protein
MVVLLLACSALAVTVWRMRGDLRGLREIVSNENRSAPPKGAPYPESTSRTDTRGTALGWTGTNDHVADEVVLHQQMPLNQVLQLLGDPDAVWLRCDGWRRAKWPEASTSIVKDYSNVQSHQRRRDAAREKLARMSSVDTSKHTSWNLGTYRANWDAARSVAESPDPPPDLRVDAEALMHANHDLLDLSGGGPELDAMLSGENLASAPMLAARWEEITVFFDGDLQLCHAFRRVLRGK